MKKSSIESRENFNALQQGDIATAKALNATTRTQYLKDLTENLIRSNPKKDQNCLANRKEEFKGKEKKSHGFNILCLHFCFLFAVFCSVLNLPLTMLIKDEPGIAPQSHHSHEQA
ncbi:hypothetical protein V6N13_043700 [Hibiscus sabdariffa]